MRSDQDAGREPILFGFLYFLNAWEVELLIYSYNHNYYSHFFYILT